MNDLQCIIFDLDGTLTQTNRLIYDSFNFIAEKYRGKIFSDTEINAMFGPPEEGALLGVVERDRLESAMDEYLSFYRANHSSLAHLHPGIEELLKYIKDRGKKIALFTGKGIHTTTITLEEFQLHQYFDFIVTGNDIVEHKPSSEGIRKIMKHFSLRREEVLMVGDAVVDIKAARAAGVRVAAVVWDSYAKEQVLAMNADFVFHSVDEFSRWLKGFL